MQSDNGCGSGRGSTSMRLQRADCGDDDDDHDGNDTSAFKTCNRRYGMNLRHSKI